MNHTARKMKFSIKDFFSKCDQIRRNLRIWSHLLKRSLMENFIFSAVDGVNYRCKGLKYRCLWESLISLCKHIPVWKMKKETSMLSNVLTELAIKSSIKESFQQSVNRAVNSGKIFYDLF